MIDIYPRFGKMRLREHHNAAAEPNPQFFRRGTHPINGPVLIADQHLIGVSAVECSLDLYDHWFTLALDRPQSLVYEVANLGECPHAHFNCE